MAIGHLAQGGQESVGRDHVAALAQDRLDQERGYVIGRHQGREQLVDGVHGGGQGRIGPAHAQGIGEGHEVDAAHERLEVRPVLDVGRGEGHGAVRAAVESAAERDHGRASRHHFGQLHRGLDRLRAGVREEETVGRIGLRIREALRQPSMQLEPGLVVDDVLLKMNALRRLLSDGGHHPGMGVPGVRHPDAARVVEVALAIGRRQPGAGGPFDDEIGIARPRGGHPGAEGGPVGQKVGGVLIHSNRLSPPASLRQRCGSVEGKVSASPGRSRV